MIVKRQWIFFLFMIAVICTLIGSLIFISLGQFDSAKWKENAGNYEGKNPRLEMVYKLERLLPNGSPKIEVDKLLGKPDGASKDKYLYYLGRDSMGPHFLLYEISFDQDGRTTKMNFRRD
jgi:hypothetical protein